MNEQEIWKDIPGYEGMYKVSNYGNVKSLSRVVIRSDGKKYPHKECIVKHFINKWGYHQVPLSKYIGANRNRKFMVHRLVAMAFVENPNNYPQINHIDGDKNNNSPDNLEWCTNSMNQKHAWRLGLNRYTGKMDRKIVQLDLDGNEIKVWDSLHQAERGIDKVSVCHLWSVLNGQRKTCGGYKWKYYED